MEFRRCSLRAALFLAAFSALLVTSCGQKSPVLLNLVQGTVLYKAKPATGARVVFHPLDEAGSGRPFPQTTVEGDGSFRLSTYTQHDGAPAGRYAVTVWWPSDAVKEEDGTPAGPDRLQQRYADPKKTPLQVEVRAGPNLLEPFHLK